MEKEADSRAKAEMKRKLSSPEGEAQYRRRKAIVEPVIGQIKNRGLGSCCCADWTRRRVSGRSSR